MHRNYFTFERQVQSLKKSLPSTQIVSCFTHRKNELVIQLRKLEDYFLRIGLESQLPYILMFKAQKIKDPHTYFFKELDGQSIKNIRIIPYDKIVFIDTESFKIECVFFGSEKNIILMDNTDVILGSFKRMNSTTMSKQTGAREKLLSADNLANIDRVQLNLKIGPFLTNRVGGFNKLLSEEVCFRSGISTDSEVTEITNDEWNRFTQDVTNLAIELKQDVCYLYEHEQKSPLLSLVKLKKVSDEYKLTKYSDINTAWKQFLYLSQKQGNFDKILNKSRQKILRRIEYLEKTLKKVSDFEELERKKRESELKGHLLQTFSSEIEMNMDNVRLKNIYSGDQELISIKLNPRLSVQENALRYFNKYKDIGKKKEALIYKRDTYEDELKYWKKTYHESEKIDNLKKAEKLEQLLVQKKLIQESNKIKKSESSLDISSFKRVLIHGNWEILIGKNAENNDILTFKFARKHDFWLHAQGVSGSHLIIRVKDKNVNPPMDVIKEAASIAAFFSGAKNSSAVPVNYTQVRYVRKSRKAAPGTVMITNSKTIFVEPKKYI